jgi:hypothetical protein
VNLETKKIFLKKETNFKDVLQRSFIVFDYELPRERERRPDILVLSGDKLIALEFKGFIKENQAQID